MLKRSAIHSHQDEVLTAVSPKLKRIAQKEAVLSAYERAARNKNAEIRPILCCDLLIKMSVGWTLNSFPLPGGMNISKRENLFLGRNLTAVTLTRLKYTGEGSYNATFMGVKSDGRLIIKEVKINSDGISCIDTQKRFTVAEQRSQQQKAVADAYIKSEVSGRLDFNPPLDCNLLFCINGLSQKSFPLPYGKIAGHNLPMGFSNYTTNHGIVSMEFSAGDNGFWITFCSKSKNGLWSTNKLLVLKDKEPKQAVLSIAEYQVAQIIKGYGLARENRYFKPQVPLLCSHVTEISGTTLLNFPGPDGKPLRIRAGLFLGKSNQSISIKAFEYSGGDNYKLTFAGKKADNTELLSTLVVNNSGFKRPEHAPKVIDKNQLCFQKAQLFYAYGAAKRTGEFIFDPPLSCERLILKEGRTSVFFPYPDGSQTEKTCSIGFPNLIFNQQIESIKYIKSKSAFLFTVSLFDIKNNCHQKQFVVFENIKGKEAFMSATGWKLFK